MGVHRLARQVHHLPGRQARPAAGLWHATRKLGHRLMIRSCHQRSANHVSMLQRFKMRLPVRDMRLVDPNLLTSETGKILVRDNGIVVSIEHVRLIIMAEQVN